MLRILLLWMISMALAAADHHLSASGDDDADGRSPATAWRSLERASRQVFAPGDRLLLRGGDRFPGSLVVQVRDGGDPSRPVTVSGAGEGLPLLLAGAGTGITVTDSGVVLRNLQLAGSGRTSNGGDGVLLFNQRPGGDRRRGIRCEGLVVSGFRRAGIAVLGWPEDGSASGFAEVAIERCQVSDTLYYGIWSDGREQPRGSWSYAHGGITVRDCIVHDITGDPAFHDNHSGNGILLGNVEGALIERCVAHDNGHLCDCGRGGPVGIWTYCARKVVIQRCESYRNRSAGRTPDGGGFDLDGGTVESLLQYNYSHDNDGAGYLVYSYKDAPHEFRDNVVRYNVSIDDGRRGRYGGITVGTHGDHVRNTLVHHNTVVATAVEGARPSAFLGFAAEGLEVRANLFIARGGAPLIDTWDGTIGSGAAFAGNAWWSDGAPLLLRHGAQELRDLAAWRAANGLPAAGDTVGDPVLAAAPAPLCFPAEVATLAGLTPATAIAGQADGAEDFAGRPADAAAFAGAFRSR